MIILIDNQIHFEVTFDPLDREEGFADDICFVHKRGRPICECLLQISPAFY